MAGLSAPHISACANLTRAEILAKPLEKDKNILQELPAGKLAFTVYFYRVGTCFKLEGLFHLHINLSRDAFGLPVSHPLIDCGFRQSVGEAVMQKYRDLLTLGQ
jgi:hypothetical protein